MRSLNGVCATQLKGCGWGSSPAPRSTSSAPAWRVTAGAIYVRTPVRSASAGRRSPPKLTSLACWTRLRGTLLRFGSSAKAGVPGRATDDRVRAARACGSREAGAARHHRVRGGDAAHPRPESVPRRQERAGRLGRLLQGAVGHEQADGGSDHPGWPGAAALLGTPRVPSNSLDSGGSRRLRARTRLAGPIPPPDSASVTRQPCARGAGTRHCNTCAAAPAARARLPRNARRIRGWYRSGQPRAGP